MDERETRALWFAYQLEDAKAAQAELDRQAAEGWELEELGLVCARFRRTEAPRKSWVEPARWKGIRSREALRQREYLELCGQAGWELLDESRGLWYFRAKPGEQPAPVQTDEGVEWETIWRKPLFDRASSLIFIGLFWTAHFWGNFVRNGYFLWEFLLSGNYMLLAAAGLHLALLLELIHGGYLLLYRRRCRRAVEAGQPFPTPGRNGARLRWGSQVALWVLLALFLLLLLLGSGEGRPEYMDQYAGYTIRTESVFGNRYTYRLFQSEGGTWVEAYDCRFSWLAGLVCRDLVALEGDEDRLYPSHRSHFHSAATPEPADLGFDQAWIYPAGEQNGLVFRQGNRVVRVEASGVDLTSPDILLQLREGLQIGG